MLDDVLRDIVAILVCQEKRDLRVELTHDPLLVFLSSVLKHALDDTTSVCICGEADNVILESSHDELKMLSRDKLDDLLNNVIAILVLDYSDNIGFKLLGQLGLLLDEDVFESLEWDQYKINEETRRA